MEQFTIEALEQIRTRFVLVHSITNLVVMNTTANILLAVGASPVMAHAPEEVEEMTGQADALVLNIGTLEQSWLESMIAAGRRANADGIPVVLDPVGAGATVYRTASARRIMDECRISVLRGNASEVFSLMSPGVETRGVESAIAMQEDMVAAVQEMALRENCVVAVSGEQDCVTDGRKVFCIKNGQSLMTRITGIGCGLSALSAAFCGVSRDNPAEAAAAAHGYYGLCGDLAITISDRPGSFYAAFLDRLYATGKEEINNSLKVEMQG
ncbi:MAG: hydroxyethylthiazole kinase [Desulfobacterales bacterium]|nr:hydroxyethylthiazole kinase [Desulfobacterales bacterium]